MVSWGLRLQRNGGSDYGWRRYPNNERYWPFRLLEENERLLKLQDNALNHLRIINFKFSQQEYFVARSERCLAPVT